MVSENKNHLQRNLEHSSGLITRLGMAAMVIATVAATAEAAVHEGQRLAAIMQPHAIYASAGPAPEQPNHDELRRSGNKEEIHHSSATYGSMKRSPSVSGSM